MLSFLLVCHPQIIDTGEASEEDGTEDVVDVSGE